MENLVILIGNLGSDPDIRYNANGLAIANFSIAINETYKDRESGEKKEVTTWSKIRVLGKQAEIIGNTLTKGNRVQILGSIRNNRWEDEKGKHNYDYILARRVRFLDRKKDAA